MNGFVYGLANNVEELPAIYKISGEASFTNDPMVSSLVSHWNQASPYVYTLGGLLRLTGVAAAPGLFWALHVGLLVLTYVALRQILSQLCRCSETTVLLSILALICVDHWNLLPGERTIFFHFMDPEYVSIAFCMAAVASVVSGRWKTSAVWVSLATVIHPLYGLPIIGSLGVLALGQSIRGEITWQVAGHRSLMCGLVGLPYSVFLWTCDAAQVPTAFDISRIQELIRSPDCHAIPSCLEMSFLQVWALPIGLASLCFIAWQQRPNPSGEKASFDKPHHKTQVLDHPHRDMSIIVVTLLGYMLAASVINDFIRIPLIVKLTPYRMAVVTIPFFWLLAVSLCNSRRKFPEWIQQPAFQLMLGVVLTITSLSCVARARTMSCSLDPHSGRWLTPAGTEVLTFISENTTPDDVFLNYSDLDVRTTCLRSDVFRFKTIPLYAEAQWAWYQRLLVVNDVPEDMDPFDYERVRDWIHEERRISLPNVLNKLEIRTTYVLVQRKGPMIDRFSSCNGESNLTRFDAEGLQRVLENDTYILYHTAAR